MPGGWTRLPDRIEIRAQRGFPLMAVVLQSVYQHS